jgi:hypothetical protein
MTDLAYLARVQRESNWASFQRQPKERRAKRFVPSDREMEIAKAVLARQEAESMRVRSGIEKGSNK